MTESSFFDSGHSQHLKPDTKNKPAAGRGRLAFNPLHPSMELPPEQLIRLLGIESKKTRKHMKMQRPSKQQKSLPAIDKQPIQHSPDQQNSRWATDEQKPQASHDLQQSHRVADEQKTHRSTSQAPRTKTADRQQRPEPQQVARPSHPMEYERTEAAVYDRKRSGWLLPALVIGLVAGVTVSGFLFWFQSPPAAEQKTPAAVVSSEPPNRPIPKQPPKGQLVQRKAAPGTGKTATLAAPAPAKAARTDHDAKRQAAITTEQNRLRRMAEQRLNQQLTKRTVSRELEDLQLPLDEDHTPAATAMPPAAAEPAFDQAVLNEPAATGTDSTPSEEASVEMIQADETKPVTDPETLPLVTPAQAVGSDSNGGVHEESTGFVDSFERDTAPDVAPAVEQGAESTIAPTLDVNTTAAFTDSTESDTAPHITPSRGGAMEAEQSTSGAADDSSSSASGDPALF